MLEYLIILSMAIISIGIAGVVASRHFIIIILSIEIMLIGASLLAISMYSYVIDGSIITFFVAIWSIAAIEVMAAVVIYRYLANNGFSMDVSKLSKLRD
jgi:NADH-quinone oxidoreductase subunit K